MADHDDEKNAEAVEDLGLDEQGQSFEELLGLDESASEDYEERMKENAERIKRATELGEEAYETLCKLGHKLADGCERPCSITLRWLEANKDNESEMTGGFIPGRDGPPLHPDVLRAFLRFGIFEPKHMNELVEMIERHRKAEGHHSA